MKATTVIGVDLGGTNIRAGKVTGQQLSPVTSEKIRSQGTVEEVLQQVCNQIDALRDKSLGAIGIGVPGLVDTGTGVVYDVVNIPSWKEVALKKELEARFKVPVYVNNDANCFALGEYHFGKGQGYDSMIGLTLGTGMGSGILINGKLYEGQSGGAGEFGMVPYLDQYYEYYCSGQFFNNVYGISGEEIFREAQIGDVEALERYREMGSHLGKAINMILYAYDPALIVIGGSVSKAWPFYEAAVRRELDRFYFKNALGRMKIEVSELEHSGLLGAAALYYNDKKHAGSDH